MGSFLHSAVHFPERVLSLMLKLLSAAKSARTAVPSKAPTHAKLHDDEKG